MWPGTTQACNAFILTDHGSVLGTLATNNLVGDSVVKHPLESYEHKRTRYILLALPATRGYEQRLTAARQFRPHGPALTTLRDAGTTERATESHASFAYTMLGRMIRRALTLVTHRTREYQVVTRASRTEHSCEALGRCAYRDTIRAIRCFNLINDHRTWDIYTPAIPQHRTASDSVSLYLGFSATSIPGTPSMIPVRWNGCCSARTGCLALKRYKTCVATTKHNELTLMDWGEPSRVRCINVFYNTQQPWKIRRMAIV